MYEYQVDVGKTLRAVDGDTVDAVVDLGFRISQGMRLRLFGINAPEHNAPGGSDATHALTDLLALALTCRIVTQKDKTEKYGRYLATIWVTVPSTGTGSPQPSAEINVNEWLVAHGHAKPYDGHGPRP